MAAPTVLDRLRGRLTGTDPRALAARREAASDLVALRDRERQLVSRLQEQSLAFDSYPFLYQRSLDAADGFGAVPWGWYGSGTLNDRKGGKDVPLFWSEMELRQFRWMSRLLCDTNPFAIGFLGLLTDFHVRGGYGWSACLRGVRKTPYATSGADADPLVAAAQGVLDEFRNGEPGRPHTSWPIRSREAFGNGRRDGEVFLRFFRGGPRTRGIPACRFVWPEQVASPSGDTSGPGSFGVLTDPDDVETVLALFALDPNGSGTDGEWVTTGDDVDPGHVASLVGDSHRVARGHVVSLKNNVDSSVKRGLPDFFPVREQLEGVRRLLHNMTEVAALQAAIGWVEQWVVASPEAVAKKIAAGEDYERLKRTTPPGYPGGRTTAVTAYEAGSILHVDANRNLMPGPTATSTQGFVVAAQAALRGCGARWRFPEYFSGDASNGTYASLKESGSPFVAAVEGGQLTWGAFERAVALKVIELAAASGRLPADAPRRLDVEVTAPKVVMTDRAIEASVADTKLRNGTLSKAEAIMADGRDPKHTFENVASEARRDAATPGVQPGEDGYGGGGGGGDGSGPNAPLSESWYAALTAAGVWVEESSRVEEAGREGLVKKVITDKRGVRRTVYVRSEPAPAGGARKAATAADRAASERHVAAALSGPATREQLGELAGHLSNLTADRLKELARAERQKLSGRKRELVDRLVAAARAKAAESPHGKARAGLDALGVPHGHLSDEELHARLKAAVGGGGPAPARKEAPAAKKPAKRPAAAEVHKALEGAYDELKLDVEFSDGLVEVPRLYHEALKAVPGLTPEQFKAELLRLADEGKFELQTLNEPSKARDPHLAPTRGDRLLYFVTRGRGR